MVEGITQVIEPRLTYLFVFCQGHNEDIMLVFSGKGLQDKHGVCDLWFSLLCVNLLNI